MRDKAAHAAKKAALITRALAALSISAAASAAIAQLSDPMAPPGEALTSDAGSSGVATGLQAVISGPGRRLALINGNIVQVGETIPGNGQLLNVGADTATIRSGEQQVELRLHPELGTKKGAR